MIRPLSVWLGVWGEARDTAPRRLLAWFGIRGIGSVYYAVYVASHDLRYSDAVELLSCVFTVVGASIVVHGVSASPLMELYQRRRAHRPCRARRGVGQTMTGLPRTLPRHWRSSPLAPAAARNS